MAGGRAARTPIPPHTRAPLGGRCPPPGPRSLRRAERSHVCTLPSRPGAGRQRARRRGTGGSGWGRDSHGLQRPGTPGRPRRQCEVLRALLAGTVSKSQKPDGPRTLADWCQPAYPSGPARRGALGLRRGPARSTRLREAREEPSAFCSLSQSGEVSARLRTLPRHRRANGRRPARCPGALRAPPKSQSRQRLLPRSSGGREEPGPLGPAPRTRLPGLLCASRRAQPQPAGLGHPSSPKLGIGPGWAPAPAQRACSDPGGCSGGFQGEELLAAELVPPAAACASAATASAEAARSGSPPSRRPTLGSGAEEHALPGGRRLRRRGLEKVGGGRRRIAVAAAVVRAGPWEETWGQQLRSAAL